MKKKLIILLAFIMLFSVDAKAFFGDYGDVKDVIASKSVQKMRVDGKPINIDGYNIKGNNYYKLRDIAVILSETEKAFDVDYNHEDDQVIIMRNKPYSMAGSGLSRITKAKAKGKLRLAGFYLDEEELRISSVNILGSNYLKLRDLASFIGFSVEYDAKKDEILIYTKDHEAPDLGQDGDFDDASALGPVTLDDIMALNDTISGDYKLEIEEGAGLKFYTTIDGKRERFYLGNYYGDFAFNDWRSAPREKDFTDKAQYAKARAKYMSDIRTNIDKAGGHNLRVTLPHYNYVFFIKPDGTEGSRMEKIKDRVKYTFYLHKIIDDLDAKTSLGASVPLKFDGDDSIGAHYPVLKASAKNKLPDEFEYDYNTIRLGEARPYVIDEDGQSYPIYNAFAPSLLELDNEANVFVIDYTVNRVKGKILVYLLNQ